MLKVTRIAVQKRNKNRYNIFIEKAGKEEYAFSLEEDTLIKEALKKGQTLDKETMDRLMRSDELSKVYNQALNYLSYRMRSTKELIQYLSDKEIDQEQIHRIITRLEKQNLLDDQAFADAYVATKVKTTFKGPERLKTELFQKGISEEFIEHALIQYSDAKQIKLIKQWLIKQAKKTTRQSHRQGLLKMKQQLIQKGFSQSVIEPAFHQDQSLEKDDEQEWEALVYQGEKAIRRYQPKAEGYMLIQKVKGVLYRRGFSQEQIERFSEQYIQE